MLIARFVAGPGPVSGPCVPLSIQLLGQWVGCRSRDTPGAATWHWVARRPGVPLKRVEMPTPIAGCRAGGMVQLAEFVEHPTLAVSD